MFKKSSQGWRAAFCGMLFLVLAFSSTVGQGFEVDEVEVAPEMELPMGRAHGVLPWQGGGYVFVGEGRPHAEADLDMVVGFSDYNGRFWELQEHGAELQDAGNAVAATPDGGFIVAGYTYREKGFGRHDIFLVKYDMYGEVEWERFWGKPFRDVAFWVGVLEDGYLVAGQTKSVGKMGDYFLMKTDTAGEMQWFQHYEAHFVDYAYSVAALEDGFLVAGTVSGFHYPSQADHHHTDGDIMLVRTDAEGKEVDRRFYGGPRNDFARSVKAAPGGGFYVCGSTQNGSAGNFDMHLMRLDAGLDTLWTKRYGGAGIEYGKAMEMDGVGNVYLWGATASSGWGMNGYLVKVNAAGEMLWSLEMGGKGSDYGEALALDGARGIWLDGYTRLEAGVERWFGGAVDEGGILRGANGCWDGEWNFLERGTQLDPGRYLQRSTGMGGLDEWGMLMVY